MQPSPNAANFQRLLCPWFGSLHSIITTGPPYFYTYLILGTNPNVPRSTGFILVRIFLFFTRSAFAHDPFLFCRRLSSLPSHFRNLPTSPALKKGTIKATTTLIKRSFTSVTRRNARTELKTARPDRPRKSSIDKRPSAVVPHLKIKMPVSLGEA